MLVLLADKTKLDNSIFTYHPVSETTSVDMILKSLFLKS